MAGDLTFNKYAAALLATALGFMLIKEISHGMMHVEKPKGLAYCGTCEPEDKGTGKAEPLPFPQEEWVLAMDAEKGEKYFQACSTCHTVNKGGDNLQGPNLWNIVGRKAGSISYDYSPGMAGMDINWGYEELDAFLTRPAKYVKGTKMGYGGEGKPKKRAALIEYLRTLSDNPLPRPEAAAAVVEGAEDVTDISEETGVDAPKVVETMKDKVEGAVDDMKDGAAGVMDKAADVAADVKDSAAGMVDKAAEVAGDVKDGAAGMVDKAAEVAGDMKDGVKEGVSEVAKDVKDAVAPQIDEGNDMIPDDTMVDKAEDKAKELVTGDE